MSDLGYFSPDWIEKTDQRIESEVCIYGATSAGVMAAIELAERGKQVVLLQPGKFIGGLTTGGLGLTDYGKKHVIGGKSAEFYKRVGREYGVAEEWLFEPHVAAKVYRDWLAEARITPLLCQYLDQVEVIAGRIESITLLGGLKVHAKVFLDCSYEGDLLAKAGVPFHVGREGNARYGETINGVQVHGKHQFVPGPIDPYVVAGDPASGLLPQIEATDFRSRQGEPDRRVQAYCFRLCMTDDPSLRIAWEKPEACDPQQYVLAERWFSAHKDEYNELVSREGLTPRKFDILTHKTPGGFHKTDTNNHGPISSDFIGRSWAWAESDYAARQRIFQEHVTYQKGFCWFMANSPAIPDRYRQAFKTWGLAKDEFTTTGGWSHTLYIREARRLVSDYVLTELDCMHKRTCDDPVGMGSYALDSHNCTRFVTPEGHVLNEGDVQIAPIGPYRISYRSIIPARGSIANLLVPVCLAASHIAYGSIRMEPVFMVLGQSAAVAASMCLDRSVGVQELPYKHLRAELDRLGQVVA